MGWTWTNQASSPNSVSCSAYTWRRHPTTFLRRCCVSTVLSGACWAPTKAEGACSPPFSSLPAGCMFLSSFHRSFSRRTAILARDPAPCGVDREQEVASTDAVQARLEASERDWKYMPMYMTPDTIGSTPINQTTASSQPDDW